MENQAPAQAPAQHNPGSDKPQGNHAAHSSPHKSPKGGHGHGGGHGDGHGGGHGGSWLVTYCDMITLLIAFFICILTFASRESGNQKYPKLRDSILYGPGGSGTAGDAHKGSDQDSLVWRQVLTSAQLGTSGSRIPPLYSDPSTDRTADVLQSLETSALGNLGDAYTVRVSMDLFFDRQGELTSSGKVLLKKIAANIRHLRHDLLIQVADKEDLPRALALWRHLERKEAIETGRLGVGLGNHQGTWNPAVWFVFLPRN